MAGTAKKASVVPLRGVAAEAGFGGVPIEAAIERMAGVGLPSDQIARVLGISDRTVRSSYSEAMALGKAKANLQVANAMFTTAVDRQHPKHVTMAIFWARVQLGWRTGEIPPGELEDDEMLGRTAAHTRRPKLDDEQVAKRFAELMKSIDDGSASGNQKPAHPSSTDA